MRGCLVFTAGILLGALVLAAAQVFLLAPKPLPALPKANADVAILFRSAFLTRELQAQITQVQPPLPLRGLIVQTEPDQNLILSGTVSTDNNLSTIPARIVLRPTVEQNQVYVQIVQVQAGTLQVPGWFFHALEGPINRQLNQALGQTSYRIVQLSTTADGLMVDVEISR